MYYSAIGLLAILILLIENRDIVLKRNDTFPQPVWQVYRQFLFAVLAYYTTDCLWGVLETLKFAKLLFADTSVYYIAMALGVFYWTQYTVTYLEEEESRFGEILIFVGRAIAGVVAIFAFFNLFQPVLFSVDEACVYHPYGARYYFLVCQILMLFLVAGYSFSSFLRQRDKSLKWKKYKTLAVFSLIMAVLLLIQLWQPFLPFYTIAYLLGTCLLRTQVISEETEDYRTKLKEAEKITALRKSITDLMNNIPALTFSKDAKTGDYVACNQAFAEYAHKDRPDEVLGLTDAELFDAETAEHFTDDDQLALSMEEPYVFYEEVRDLAGNPRQFQTTKLKYVDDEGRLCTLGLSQDVTDLVRIQRENVTNLEAYERERESAVIYSHIARTLLHGYTNLFYVNMETGEFIEYRTDDNLSTLSEERRGWHFFEACKREAETVIFAEDRSAFLKAMDRQTLTDSLNQNNTFVMTYRVLLNSVPTCVNMRISRMEDDSRIIIIGVTNVDEQVRRLRTTD